LLGRTRKGVEKDNVESIARNRKIFSTRGGTLAIGVWGLNHTVPGIAVGLFAGTAVALVVTRRPRR